MPDQTARGDPRDMPRRSDDLSREQHRGPSLHPSPSGPSSVGQRALRLQLQHHLRQHLHRRAQP